jgi:Mrp family chromosome partitioning ATPase
LATTTSPKAAMLGFAGGFGGLTLGSLLALLLELRDKGFRTSAQVQQQIGPLTVSATPRALGRQRKSPAAIILHDNRSAFAEAFRVSWANIQLAVAGPRSAYFGERRLGTALGITSASIGEGKSTHALGLARTAALAGEKVVLVDADLRRSGVSRLLDPDPRFTLRDFLERRCAADDVIDIEERSGVRFVSSASSNFPWTSQDLQRFSSFVDYLKNRFTIVIIDLPPILGVAETIRLATAADNIALVIRWGRTERQFVQFALDALRRASASPIAVILNDIDLKAQRRRGYSDGTSVYTDKELYRAAPEYGEPAVPASLSMAAAEPAAHSEAGKSEPQRDDAPYDGPRPAGSAIERWYEKYHG